MAKHAGAYKSEKRKKELLRQKKQEEKRQRRLKKEHASEATEQEHLGREEDSGTSTGESSQERDRQEDIS